MATKSVPKKTPKAGIAAASSAVKKAAKKTATKKTYCVMCPTWEIKHPERCSNTQKKGAKTLYFCTKRCKDKYIKSEKSA